MAYKDYHIDGWRFSFPRAWPMSLDEGQRPPQLIFEVPEEPVTVYVSVWNFRRPGTGEAADAETVRSLMAQALDQQGGRVLEGVEDCCPPGLLLCVGQSDTTDGYEMTSCFLCAEGGALSVYFVCGEGADVERYLPCLKRVGRAPSRSGPPLYPQNTEK